MSNPLSLQKNPTTPLRPSVPATIDAPEKKEETEMTDAQIEERRKEMLMASGMLPRPRVEKPEATAETDEAKQAREAKEKADAEAAETKRLADEAELARVEEEKRKAAPPKPAGPTPEEIAEKNRKDKLADDAAEAERQRIANLPKPFSIESLDEEDRKDYEALLHLEKTSPDEFKGKAAEHLDYVGKFYAYQDEWVKNNPGKEFDETADEHQEFYDKNLPEIPEASLDEAKKVVEAAKVQDTSVEDKVKKEVEPLKKKLQEKELKEKLVELIPVRATAVGIGLTELIRGVDPEILKLVTGTDGKLNLSPENEKKVADYDPFTNELLEREGKILALEIDEIVRFTTPDVVGLGYSFDVANKEGREIRDNDGKLLQRMNVGDIHRTIGEIASDGEETISKLPEANRIRDGKKFATSEEFNKMIVKAGGDQAKISEIFASFWHLGPDDLRKLVTDHHIAKIRSEIDDVTKKSALLAKKKTISAIINSPDTTPAPNATPPEVKHTPPRAVGGTDIVDNDATKHTPPKSFGEIASKTHFG